MDRTAVLRSLRLFNEKAEKLSDNSFSRRVFGQESGVTISAAVGQPVVVERRGPDQESIEVFVLTLRFFMQDNEPSSLRNVGKVYDAALVSSELKARFREARQALSDYLDSETYHATQSRRLTNREILETFVWGGLAHANPQMKKRYDSWMSLGGFSEVFWNTLVVVLATFMKALAHIHDINAEVILAMGEVP